MVTRLVSSIIPTSVEQNQLTNTAGIAINENHNSKTAGPVGPSVIEDFYLLNKNAMFNRERIPERVVHGKGTGAYGTFTVTNDITKYTKAKIFMAKGKQTDCFVRFSSAVAERGYPDTVRDMRGFAIKFYTEDGNWDLTCNSLAPFFINDGKRFPDLMHAMKREPATNLKSETMKWDFLTQTSESLQTVAMLFSDRGIPYGFPYMDGFSQNTYSFVNLSNERYWIKFHLKTQQGVKCLAQPEANALAGKDPDFHARQLIEMIDKKEFPKWKMYVQIMPEEAANTYHVNPFDPSKVWPHNDYPLIEVGILELNRNPTNFFAEVEQVGFQPSNLVPGISPSPDKVLQARLFAYADAQRYRMGVNFERLPINAPHGSKVMNTYAPDGLMRFDDNGKAGPNYEPNSYGGPKHNPAMNDPPYKLPVGPAGFYDPIKPTKDADFVQARNFWRILTPEKREILCYNMADSLGQTPKEIQGRALEWISKAEQEWSDRVHQLLEQHVHY